MKTSNLSATRRGKIVLEHFQAPFPRNCHYWPVWWLPGRPHLRDCLYLICLGAYTVQIAFSQGCLSKTIRKANAVVHTCSSSCSGGLCERTAWAQKFKASLGKIGRLCFLKSKNKKIKGNCLTSQLPETVTVGANSRLAKNLKRKVKGWDDHRGL